jgi:hypothetical protein
VLLYVVVFESFTCTVVSQIRTQFAKLAHAAQQIMEFRKHSALLARPVAERDDILRRVQRAVSYGQPPSPARHVSPTSADDWHPVAVHIKLREDLMPRLKILQQQALALIRDCLRERPDDRSAVHAAAKPFFDVFRTAQLLLLSPPHSGIVVVPKST